MPVYTSTPKTDLGQREWTSGVVTYIQSTGTQFIDTEFPITSNNLKVEISFSYTEFTDYGTIIGCQGDINFILRQYGGGLWLYPSGTRLRDITINTKYTVTITLNSGTWTVSMSPGSGEDTSVSDTFSGTYEGTIVNNLNICLFNTTNVSNGSYGSQVIPSINAKAKIYSCKIYQDDVLVRNFSVTSTCSSANAPVVLYDSVTNRIFYNKGSGYFKGDTDSPSFSKWYTPKSKITEYEPLDYLETSGTQYIDTEYYPTADTGIELDFMWLGSGTTAWVPICGIRGSNSNYYCWFVNGTSLAVSPNYSTYDPGGGYSILKDKRYRLSNVKGCTMFNKIVTHNTSLTIKTETVDTFHLGCISNNGSVDNRNPYMRIYGFKIFEDFTPVCDMRPCRRKSDGALGLYDLITGKFHTNKGTGAFVAGKVSRKKLIGVYKDGKSYEKIYNAFSGANGIETELLYPASAVYTHSSNFPETLIDGLIFVPVDANGNLEFVGYSSGFSEDEYDKTTRYTISAETNSFVVAPDQTTDIGYSYIRSKKYDGTPVKYWVGTHANSGTTGKGCAKEAYTMYIPDTFKGLPVTNIAAYSVNDLHPLKVKNLYIGNNAQLGGTNAIAFICSVTAIGEPELKDYPIANIYLGKNITSGIEYISGTSTRIFYYFDKDNPAYYSNNELYPGMVFNQTKDTLYIYEEYAYKVVIPYGVKTIDQKRSGYNTHTYIIPETVTDIVGLSTNESTITLVCKCSENQTLNLPSGFLNGSSKGSNTVTIYTDNLSLRNYEFGSYVTVTFYSLAEYVEE